MEFTIYSIGDSSFLEQILISIAMISGSGSLTKLAMIGALLGVIFVLVQSIFQGAQSVNVQHILLGWVIYMCMFGPTAKVIIEDAYSDDVRVVANVPASVGMAGGLISNIGYGITEMFEQGFGAIGPGENRKRYMESLEILTELQRNGNDSAIFTALNYNMGGGDIRKSWDNYIRECTATKIDLGESSIDEMAKQPIYDALRFDSSVYGTQVFLPNQEDLTCSEAFSKLKLRTGAIKDNPDVLETVNRVLGYNPEDAALLASPIDRASAALHNLGANAANAYDFMQAAILEPLYLDAVMGKHQDLHDNTAAIMLNQAIQQRNTQWAAEQSMFMTVARPLMAFFEGFIFAVTPVMAFLIMLGGMGLSLAMKYVQSLLWIQLWMPTLAVTNLYIHNAVTHEFAAKFNIQEETMTSMYALNTAADILGNWIAVGGMLAAATPMISLFFVTGSTYAFTSLAQRIGGADHVNEKMVAPDIMSTGPVAQFAAQHQGDVFRGLQASGTETLMTGVTMGGSLDSATASANTAANQASEQFQQQFARTWQNAWEQGNGAAMAGSVANMLKHSETDSAKAALTAVKNFAHEHNLSDDQSNALLGVLTAGAGVAAQTPGGKPVKLQGDVGGKIASEAVEKAGLSYKQAQSFADNADINKAFSSLLTTDVAKGLTQTRDDSWRVGMSDTDAEALTKTAGKAVTATQTYEQLNSARSTAGAALKTDMRTLGSQVAANQVATNKLEAAFLAAPKAVKDEANELEQRYKAPLASGGLGMSPAHAKAAARLTAMTNAANFEGGVGLSDSYNNALDVISAATGRNLGQTGDANSNAGMERPNVDGVPQQVNNGVSPNVGRVNRGEIGGEANKNLNSPDLQQLHNDTGAIVRGTANEYAAQAAMPTIISRQDDLIAGNKIERTLAANAFSPTGKALGDTADMLIGKINGLFGTGQTWEQKQDAMYGQLFENGRNDGLTPAQAHYLATIGSHQTGNIDQAYYALHQEVMDRNGYLTEQGQQDLTNAMARDLQYSAYRSESPAAYNAGLSYIRGLNMAQEPLHGSTSLTAPPNDDGSVTVKPRGGFPQNNIFN